MCKQIDVHTGITAYIGKGFHENHAIRFFASHFIAEIATYFKQSIWRFQTHIFDREIAIVVHHHSSKTPARLVKRISFKFLQHNRRAHQKRPLLGYAINTSFKRFPATSKIICGAAHKKKRHKKNKSTKSHISISYRTQRTECSSCLSAIRNLALKNFLSKPSTPLISTKYPTEDSPLLTQ